MKNDPSQIKVRYTGKCATCGVTLPKGVNAYYWPIGRALYCLSCGDQPYREFLLSIQDEDMYNLRVADYLD